METESPDWELDKKESGPDLVEEQPEELKNDVKKLHHSNQDILDVSEMAPLQVDDTPDVQSEAKLEDVFENANDSHIFDEDDLEGSQNQLVTAERMISSRTNQEPGLPLTERQKNEISKLMRKVRLMFKEFNTSRDSELLVEAEMLQKLMDDGLLRDLELLDRIETENIVIYSAITRYRLRIVNQQNEIVSVKYLSEDFNLVDICFSLIERSSTALGYEDEKLFVMIKVLTLILHCFEFGLFTIKRIRGFLRAFFLKTEFINKQEEYISKHQDSFSLGIFEKLMECKSLCSQILLHIVTLINDDWLFHYSEQSTVDDLLPTVDNSFKLFKRKQKQVGSAVKEHAVFICDGQYYSFFSFIMFNYLLKELRKGEKMMTDKNYLQAMHNLVLYVYDYREDPFILSLQLLKIEYLSYYLRLEIEDEHIKRANEIISLIGDARKKFREGSFSADRERPESIERLEQDIGNIFGTLEILMGLQDETYSIRLMLTEKNVPALLVEIFTAMQDSYIGESGDELFIQGLKVLYQLCRGNYPAQAQITKGKSWLNLKKLIKGPFSVFNILFLKQLFEEDTQYLHINKDFAIEIIDLFSDTFDTFFKMFTSRTPIKNAKDLVSLYAFKSLVHLFIKIGDVPYKIRQAYNLPIGNILHKMVENFAFPLFKENYVKIEKIYEPKLITKNWKLEDGSFLVSLMQLSGDHIKCMLVDFGYSLIKLYNKSCEHYFPSTFFEGMYRCLPLDMAPFDYLLSFSEGIKFKTEIMNTYCIFRIFSQSSKIPERYTPSELSLEGVDTNLDFVPDNHIKELPDMIIAELNKFEAVHDQRDSFERDDLIEYLLNGLCQMCYKYANGVIWYFLSIEKEEVKMGLAHRLQQMTEKLRGVVRIVMDEKPASAKEKNPNGPTAALKKLVQDPQSGISDKLGQSLVRLIENIEMMVTETPYEYILKKYELNLKSLELKKLNITKKLLRCEATFLSVVPDSDKNKWVDADESKLSTEQITINGLVRNYKAVKKGFLRDKKKNKFYEVLQSKMENTNQNNLISYVCQALESIEYNACNYNSLWFSKSAISTIVFLNNTMFWCPKTRIKLFEYLQKYPLRRQKLISVVYKALRDSFSILAYCPFINEQWEYIFSRFYIFSSFIKGLCKQNCQEFKLFFGEFKPILKCQQHAALNNTVLTDLVAVLMKFLNFSGISYNKQQDEYPSDRLSTVMLTQSLCHCIIEMLTGPCKPNQIKIYNKGNIIWLNMFNRVINNLDSNYYSLMNIVLDYLLSLIEGNTNDILKSFATTFDAPVLYGVMTKLLTLLWRRVMRKRKRDLRKKLEKRVENLQMSRNSVRSVESRSGEKSSQIITMEVEKINNWSDLISMYTNGDFENHLALSCSIKIFIFLSRVAYRSKKYQIFFDLKESQLNNEYTNAGFKQEDIRLNQTTLKGKTNASEDLIVYYFIKHITARVEIKDSNHNSEIFIFPKRPMCFFLREATKTNFKETCQIENTEAKLIDMFESFQQFYLEMQSYQKFKSTYRVVGRFATDKSFNYLRLFCYLLSIVINALILYDVTFTDFKVYLNESTPWVFSLSIFLNLISIVSLGLWMMSNYQVAWIESYRKFKVKHPYRNPYLPVNLIVILSEVFLRKEVINFVIHIALATSGISYSVLFQCFHLGLIINISETTKYVLKAITKHIDQLFATMTLVAIFIYIFSNFLGKFYGPLFNPDAVSGLNVCGSLKSCFFTTLNLGLRAGGGIAETMKITDIESRKYNFYGKLIFDLGFFMFVNIICLNVIFGIIIDTFSELRTKQREREWDHINNCDICGIERKIFEKKGMEFTFHKHVEHNLWDYVFYLVYLHTLEEQSLTGFEYFVLTKFRQKSTAWLPINSTVFLKSSTESQDESINLLQQYIKESNKHLEDKLEERFSIIMKGQRELKTMILNSMRGGLKSMNEYGQNGTFDNMRGHNTFSTGEEQDFESKETPGNSSRRNY